MIYNTLDKRMKRYEKSTDLYLTRRTPVILRLDMCAGHTFTKGFNKPFDSIFMASMMKTMEALCKDIQGAVFGYTQSDEITLILCDYQTTETDSWFDYRLEKLCSVSASKASRYFNKFFIEYVNRESSIHSTNALNKIMNDLFAGFGFDKQDTAKSYFDDHLESLYRSRFMTADFDCRAFNVPYDDVCNCLIWRQQDAEKNSIQALAQSLYEHEELHKVSCKALQNKLFTEKGVNWNDLETCEKRGTACKRDTEGKWVIDFNTPIFKKSREYVEDCITFEEE